MNKKIGITGGDLRIGYLAELLAKDKYIVNTYAIDVGEHVCARINSGT